MIYRNGVVANPETCGQIACSVGRLPIRFTVGTGGTIRADTGLYRCGSCSMCPVRKQKLLTKRSCVGARGLEPPNLTDVNPKAVLGELG